MNSSIIAAEMVASPENDSGRIRTPPIRRSGGKIRRGIQCVWRFTQRWVGNVFGFACLVVGLAILATIPILQMLSLGYFLESSRRVILSGQIRSGVLGLRKARTIGVAVLGTWFCMLPVRIVSSLADSVYLIHGPNREYQQWRLVWLAATILTIGHLVWAWLRGAKLRHFLWPSPVFLLLVLTGRRKLNAWSVDPSWSWKQLRLGQTFWLGCRGFAGALAWLFVPVCFLIGGTVLPEPLNAVGIFAGTITLAMVVSILPFLQARFAVTNRIASFFEVTEIRHLFRQAPIAYWASLSFALVSSLPLYILKAELIPREAAWLPSLLFVVMIFPARLFVAWAMARSVRRQSNRHWFWQLVARLGYLPVLLTYVLIVYFTQYVSWYGRFSLFEQHAFLLPVPFLGY